MTETPLPFFILSGDLTELSGDVAWDYNDGSGSNLDLWLPSLYRRVVEININSIQHSSHLIVDPPSDAKRFSGVHVKPGQWITNDFGGRAAKIVDVLYTSPTRVVVVYEDIARYNTFEHRGVAGSPRISDGEVLIFDVDNDKWVPNFANIFTGELPGTIKNPAALVSIASRFEFERNNFGVFKQQVEHGFERGDLLRFAKSSEITPTTTVGQNTTPSVTSGEQLRINEQLITWDANYTNATDIVNYLDSLNIDNGNIVPFVDTSGAVGLEASDGRDIVINDIAGNTSVSVGLDIVSSGNGVYEGKLIKTENNLQEAVAIVSKLGPSPDYFYLKWLGEIIDIDGHIAGFVGDTLFKNKNGSISQNPFEGQRSVYVKMANPKQTILVGKENGGTTTAPQLVIGFDDKNEVLLPATNLPSDLVNAINSAFASDELVADYNMNGVLTLTSPRNLPFYIWDATNNVLDGYGLKPVAINGREKTRVIALQQPNVPLQRIDLPTVVRALPVITLPSTGDEIVININGNTYTYTLEDLGLSAATDIEPDEIVGNLNNKPELIYEGFVADNTGPTGLQFWNNSGGPLSVEDGSVGQVATDVFGSTPFVGLQRGGHGAFFETLNNTGSNIDETKVVKTGSYAGFNEKTMEVVSSVDDIPIGITLTETADTETSKVLTYGVIYSQLDTSSATPGDRIYFDTNGDLTLVANSVPIGFVYEVGVNAQVFINIRTPDSDKIKYFTDTADSAFGTNQFTTVPMTDVQEMLYVHINGLGSADFTFNTTTLQFTHDNITAGFDIETGDEITYVYKAK